jgi:hypothetical protein
MGYVAPDVPTFGWGRNRPWADAGLGGSQYRRRVTGRQRLFADLARSETPTGRDELGFLTFGAVAIVVTAQLSDPGSLLEIAIVSVAVLAFVLRGLPQCRPSCSPH